MTRARRAFVLALSVLALSGTASTARAQAPPEPAPADDAKLAAAKELFRQGVVLFNAGDLERALDLFLRSRAALAAGKNTTNAAICLERLGRFDEAIELYEEVLTRFAPEVDEADRRAVAATLSQLRQKVASLDVSSNVDGAVVIDGRPRARLPLATPIRLLPGRHLVRVLKDGYATAEASVEVKVAVTSRVDLPLTPLAAAGQLRVEDPSNPGAEVFVDGVGVGEAPWQGTLGPGRHVVFLRRGDVGTGPTSAVVIQGQSSSIALRSVPLGATVRVEIEPATADLSIDGVSVGHGAWEGRLPIGAHRATASEAGYFDSTLNFASGVQGAPTRGRLRLAIDPKHPRWPRVTAGRLWITAWGGFGGGGPPGGGADKGCPGSCDASGTLVGGGGGGRVAYSFPSGLALELEGGYLAFGANISRRLNDKVGSKDEPVAYALKDDVIIRGPFGAAGASYRLGPVPSFAVSAAANFAVMGASTRDAVTGTLTAGHATTPATLDGQNTPVLAVTLLAIPELRAELLLGKWSVGLGAAAPIFLVPGPKFPYDLLRPAQPCDPKHAVTCTAGSDAARAERSFEHPVVFMPTAFLGYGF